MNRLTQTAPLCAARLPRTLLSVALALASCSAEVEPRPPADSQAAFRGESSIAFHDADCGVGVRRTNTRFIVDEVPDALGYLGDQPLLLQEEIESNGCLRQEKLPGVVRVRGWVNPAKASGAPAWTFEAEGEEGAVAFPFFKVVNHGCCGGGSTHSYFSMHSGRQIFQSTVELLAVLVPDNTLGSRYAGFLDSNSTIDAPEAAEDRSLIGVLQYGAFNGDPDRLAISGDLPGAYALGEFALERAGKNWVRGSELIFEELVPAGREGIGGFRINVELFEMTGSERHFTLSVPVQADHIDASGIALPPGIRVRHLPGS